MRLLLLLFFILVGLKVSAVELENAEASYIYNFIRYVKWPENSTKKDFVIGVYGESAIYDILIELSANRKIGTQKIAIKKVTGQEELLQCNVLFIPNSQKKNVKILATQIGNKPILLVSESTNSNDCTIEFVQLDNKLHFKINEEKAKQQNLYLSQSLINLSK